MSLLFQWVKQVFPPPRAKWSLEDMPDLSGKVALVTGGNAGIGREIVKALLRKNAKVYLAARSPEKAQKVIEELASEEKAGGGNRAEFLKLDLSDLAAVREAALEFKKRETRIDMLFLNAGIMCPSPDELTAQGADLTFGTNVTGHFLFFRLLYPLLLAASSSPASTSLSDTAPPHAKRRKAGMMAMYAQSKLAPISLSTYIAKEAARKDEKLMSIAADPGHTRSEIFHRGKAWYWQLWESLITYPTPYGAITPLYAGTAPEAASMNGKYLRPWARPGRPNPSALDENEQKKLWDWLEKQVESYL
ncbi:NAD-P-binding protein [Daedaleopsis nitida]|nr:NAD-P-binding protein [Daedaleopsis nitida]